MSCYAGTLNVHLDDTVIPSTLEYVRLKVTFMFLFQLWDSFKCCTGQCTWHLFSQTTNSAFGL